MQHPGTSASSSSSALLDHPGDLPATLRARHDLPSTTWAMQRRVTLMLMIFKITEAAALNGPVPTTCSRRLHLHHFAEILLALVMIAPHLRTWKAMPQDSFERLILTYGDAEDRIDAMRSQSSYTAVLPFYTEPQALARQGGLMMCWQRASRQVAAMLTMVMSARDILTGAVQDVLASAETVRLNEVPVLTLFP